MCPSPLRRLADDLWVAERPQAFFGLPVGTRMTVIRLPAGASCSTRPVALDPGSARSSTASAASSTGWLRTASTTSTPATSRRRIRRRGSGWRPGSSASARTWFTRRCSATSRRRSGGSRWSRLLPGPPVRERGRVPPPLRAGRSCSATSPSTSARGRLADAAPHAPLAELRALRPLDARPAPDPRPARGAREPRAHPRLGLRPRGGGARWRARARRPRGAARGLRLAPPARKLPPNRCARGRGSGSRACRSRPGRRASRASPSRRPTTRARARRGSRPGSRARSPRRPR